MGLYISSDDNHCGIVLQLIFSDGHRDPVHLAKYLFWYAVSALFKRSSYTGKGHLK